MDTIHLKIASPERVVFDDEVIQIRVPTNLGEITILPHHIPLVTSIIAGELVIKKEDEEVTMALSGGFLEINTDGVTVLADTAERAEEIDEARAEEARQRASELLKEKHVDSVEYAALATKLEKELARLRVVRKRRRRI